MTNKIRPTREIPKWERYNCTGRLRVEVKKDKGEVIEVIVLPKEGGCETNLKCIASLITGMLECNIAIDYICEILEGIKACPAPAARMRKEDLPREKTRSPDQGFGQIGPVGPPENETKV